MKEKDLEKILKEVDDSLDAILDKHGLREDFEKFQKEQEGETLEDLLGELKERLNKTMKPKFKIVMESDEDGEGCHLSVEGSSYSLLLALSHLVGELLQNTNLTEKAILQAVKIGLANEEE